MCTKSFDLVKKCVYSALFLFIIVYLLLSICWLVVFIRKCYFQFISFLRCYKSDTFHPIHSDVKFLQKQRKLYNLQTHFVKCLLLSVSLFIEVARVLCFLLSDYFQANIPFPANDSVIVRFEQSHNCHIHNSLRRFYYSSPYILLYNLNFLLAFLLYVMISILSRYLAARYLNHPFSRTLVKYVIWILIQCVVTAVCSTIYTIAATFLIFPLIVLINFTLLVRDSLVLSRVLKSNVLSLRLHGSRALYTEQKNAFVFYRIFRLLYLLSICLELISLSFLLLYKTADLFLEQFCFAEFLYGIDIPAIVLNTLYMHRYAIRGLECVSQLIGITGALLFVLSLNLPLFGVILWPVVRGLVKRCTAKEGQFRFNYDNMEPLLRHHKQ